MYLKKNIKIPSFLNFLLTFVLLVIFETVPKQLLI